jgi:hypothetical protein
METLNFHIKENVIASLAPAVNAKPRLHSNANTPATCQNTEATEVGDCLATDKTSEGK